MARQKGTWSSDSYASTVSNMQTTKQSVTHVGQERVRSGQGLSPLVDPKSHECKRESRNLLVPGSNGFELQFGTALPVRKAVDTTGSVGEENVKLAFEGVSVLQKMLVVGEKPILGRYHGQFATIVIQDYRDRYCFQHTEFEPDNQIEEQMRLFAPAYQGSGEGAEYYADLYYAAYRTEADIWKYGLKGYMSIVADEKDFHLDQSVTIIDRLLGLRDANIPSFGEVVKEAMKKWHLFYFKIQDVHDAKSFWSEYIGSDHFIDPPCIEDIPHCEATIFGLTEGVLDLSNAAEFLLENSKQGNRRMSKERANQIVRAVQHIPLRAQANLPGFDKIPLAGSIFAKREDLWPIEGQIPVTTGGGISWENQL